MLRLAISISYQSLPLWSRVESVWKPHVLQMTQHTLRSHLLTLWEIVREIFPLLRASFKWKIVRCHKWRHQQSSSQREIWERWHIGREMDYTPLVLYDFLRKPRTHFHVCLGSFADSLILFGDLSESSFYIERVIGVERWRRTLKQTLDSPIIGC